MNRDERIQTLLSKDGCLWKASDVPFLKALSDNAFANIESTSLKALEAKPAAPVAPKTAEEYIAAAPEGMREMLSSGLKTHNEQKTSLITEIKKVKTNKFTDEQLGAKSLDELKTLVELAGITVNSDFSGRIPGAAGEPKVNDDQPEPMPAMTFTK